MFWFMNFFVTVIVVSGLLSLILISLGLVLMKKFSSDRELQSPFECGFSTFSEFRLSFSIHFFLIALVFVVFDVELIILFPYITCMAVSLNMTESLFYLLILSLLTYGLLNEWNQMVLEWMK